MTRQNAELRAIRAAEKAQEEQEEERIRFHAAEMERITSLRRQHEAFKHDPKMKTVQRMIDEVRRRQRGWQAVGEGGWGWGGVMLWWSRLGVCLRILHSDQCSSAPQPRPSSDRRLGV